MARVGRTIRGFGDYSIGSNTILQGGMSPPMITNSVVNGGVIVRHREYLRDIIAAELFTNLQFSINPGITETFPWLSQIANSFEQYRFRGLVFEFKSTSADVVLSSAASTALGTVVMGTKYNVLDDPFTNKFEMENWEFTTSCKPSNSCMHPIECAKSQTPVSMLYIRAGDLDPAKDGDKRLYDLANFNIAVVGLQNSFNAVTSAIGELWCTYEIELYKPKLEEDISTSFAHFSYLNATVSVGEPDTNQPFGTQTGTAGKKWYPDPTSNSTLPCYIIPDEPNPVGGLSTLGKLHIPDSIAKRLKIDLYWYWYAGGVPVNSFTTAAYNAANSRGLTPIIAWEGDTTGQVALQQFNTSNPTLSASIAHYTIIFEVTEDNAYLCLQDFTYIAGGATSQYDFWITELGPNAN